MPIYISLTNDRGFSFGIRGIVLGKSLTYLNVSRTNLRNLDGVQDMEKLMTISAKFLPGKDLTPLSSLKHLVELELDGWGNKDGLDVSPLHDLKSLAF